LESVHKLIKGIDTSFGKGLSSASIYCVPHRQKSLEVFMPLLAYKFRYVLVGKTNVLVIKGDLLPLLLRCRRRKKGL